MNFYGYQQPSYGGMPHMGSMGGPTIPSYGAMYPQGQIYPH